MTSLLSSEGILSFLFAVDLQVELFCVNHLINCSLESTEEFICVEFRFTMRDGGMRAAFQLLHMVLEVYIHFSLFLQIAFINSGKDGLRSLQLQIALINASSNMLLCAQNILVFCFQR